MHHPWAHVLFSLVGVLTAVTYGVLAWISYRRGPDARYRTYWVAFCALGALHILSIPSSDFVDTATEAVVAIRISMILSCLVLPLFLQFSLAFTRQARWARVLAAVVWIWGLAIIILLSTTDWILAGATASEFAAFAPVMGPVAPLYMLFNATVWLTPIGLLILGVRRSEGRARTRMAYMLAAVIFGLFGTTGFLLPGILQSQTVLAFLPAFLLPLFPLTITAAIVRHRLWGIESILHRTAAWAALSVALLLPIAGVIWLAVRWLPPLGPLLLSALLTLGFLLAFVYLRLLKPVVDHWFQRRELDRQRELTAFSREMASLRKPEEVVARILDSVAGALYPRRAVVWVRADAKGTFALGGQRPDQPDAQEEQTIAPPPAVLLAAARREPGLIESIRGQSGHKQIVDPAVEQALAERQTSVLAPLVQAGEIVGLLELGPKLSLKHYGHGDLRYVEQLCAAGAVGLSNALLFGQVDSQRKELFDLSAHLEQRVQERTGELQEANAQLKDLDRLKSRFFANISHELRTPLSLILSPLDSMIEDALGRFDPEQRDHLKGLRRNALQLLKLIDDLLDLSKLEEARLKLRVADVDLSALASRLVDATAPMASRKKIEVQLDQTDPVIIEADGEKLERVLINLLGNALKFSPDGTRVDLEIGADEEWAWVAVRDQGVGIPAHQLETIFDRFHQVDDSLTRSRTGSGIGLSLAKELTELHGGRIEVESEEGRGSTFTVRLRRSLDGLPPERLDRRKQQEPAGESRREDDRGLSQWNAELRSSDQYRFLDIARATDRRTVQRGRVKPAKTARLLAVDDNPDLLQYLEQILGQQYEIWHVTDGKRALDLLLDQRHDLVLSDVMMPGMSGLELCQRIKTDPRVGDTPVILLTARAGERGRIEGHWVGADQYLAKPFKPAELRAAIEAQLAGRKRRVENASHRRAAALETLLAGLAHELRNACHQARSAQTALLELHHRASNPMATPIPADAVEEMHAISRRALDRIAAVVKSLQQYSVQRMRVPWSTIDLDGMIQKEVRHLVSIDQRGISLDLALQARATVRGPREEIRQLILNLVENAAKAVDEGGRIRVATRSETGQVVLEVEDDGCGIEPEMRDRIFDLFFTTRDPGQGVGLGLALAKKTVEDMRGTIEVDSEVGRGTVFRVRLPRESAVEADGSADRAAL